VVEYRTTAADPWRTVAVSTITPAPILKMTRITHPICCLLLVVNIQVAWSSDACSTRAILATADVSVSDGSTFKVETFFHSESASAIRHIRDDERLIAVEGPLSWTRSSDSVELGTDFHKLFALGHQFHAFLLHFENIVSNFQRVETIDFQGDVYSGVTGDYPYGGVVSLIESDDETRPAGLLFEFPETSPISVVFADWREIDGGAIPYRVKIDDSKRVFDYRYLSIDLAPKSPLWFFEEIEAPAIDHVQVYRLHRKLLAAHCIGDADLMSVLTAPEIVIASRGQLQQYQNSTMRERFTDVFQRLDYAEYHDIATPIIDISKASDIGWVGANVRAIGTEKKSDVAFDDQWAWVMMVREINDVWVHAGNSSSHAQ